MILPRAVRRGAAPALLALLTACGAAPHPMAPPQLLARAQQPVAGPSAPAVPLASPAAPTTAGVRALVRTATGRTVPVPLVGGDTIESVLAAAHVTIPNGPVRSVVTSTVVGHNYHAGTVQLDGHPALVTTPVAAGDTVTVVAGAATVEGTDTVLLSVPVPGGAALYAGGVPGRDRVVRGTLSHEVVRRTVLTAPKLGHLRRPGAVALTFDDGPDPSWTPQVLRLLAAAHVHATFCLIGRNALRYPQLVRDIVAAGHTLCDHTFDHDERLRFASPQQIHADIAHGYAAIEAAAGGKVSIPFFRAPGGGWSAPIVAEATAEHMRPLRWTVDPKDWSRPSTASILQTVYQQVRPGGVILMHDGGGDRSQSVAALSELLRTLPAMGYSFVLPSA